MKSKTYKVSKTKIAKAPWEEEKFLYNVKETKSSSLFSSDMYVFILQVIVGISIFIWVYNR